MDRQPPFDESGDTVNMKVISSAACVMALSAFAVAPAGAESTWVTDRYNASPPALNVQNGRFGHNARAATFRVKFEALSRERTVLVVRYYARDYTIQVKTQWVNGTKRVVAQRFDDTSSVRLSSHDISAKWDARADVIRVRLPEAHLQGTRADFHAWSQAKGAMHGNHFGDELFVARLERG